MKTLSTKSILSALGIVALLAGPALAAKPNHQSAPKQTIQSPSVQQYPEAMDGGPHTGTASNQFETDHGYYSGGHGS